MPALTDTTTIALDEEAVPYRGARRVVLTGFMGAGKTTVGRLLSDRLGWRFLDTDTEVELRHGRTIGDMFRQEGEAMFRRRESLAIARALGQQDVVIALGGGAPEFLNNRLLLEQTPGTAVIFLNAPFVELFDRCVLQEGSALRPVLLDAEVAAERYRVRVPFYQRCAQRQFETADKTPPQVAGSILRFLCQETGKSIRA